MIENIIEYFNHNKLASVLLIVLLILVVIYICSLSQCPKQQELENFSSPKVSCNQPPTDEQFYTTFVQNKSHLINFKCSFNNIDYYLATVKKTDCTTSESVDCNASNLILINCSDVDVLLDKYLTNNITESSICNSTKKIKCLAGLTSPTPEQEEQCALPTPSCEQHRQFMHDFNVTEIVSVDNLVRKYLIKGTSIPLVNGASIPTLFNQWLYFDKNINHMCGDDYQNRKLTGSDMVEVMVVEDTGTKQISNIIGGLENPLKIILKFRTNTYIPGTDKNKNPINVLLNDKKNTYLGICPNLSCSYTNGKTYPRVCLYDDPLDSNVLKFQPMLV